VRLDPKLRYLAELAALKQRRTLSSFIEWAIEDCMTRVCLLEETNKHHSITLADAAEYLWDVDDADRFIRLALHYPELLTHEEQIRWKLIRENGHLWKGGFVGDDYEWAWKVKEESLIFERLRLYWEIFCGVARGELAEGTLPEWERNDIPAPSQDSPH
jgi:hypothetical protein